MSEYMECGEQLLEHASTTFPSLPCLRHKGQHACKYTYSAHSFNNLHVSDSIGVWLNRCVDIGNAVDNDWNMCPPQSDPCYACDTRTACMQIYTWSAHLFNNLYVTCVWLNLWLDTWNAVSIDWRMHPPHSSDKHQRT